jgi:hypothetical protein
MSVDAEPVVERLVKECPFFPEYFAFSLPVSFHQCITLVIRSSATGHMQSWQMTGSLNTTLLSVWNIFTARIASNAARV